MENTAQQEQTPANPLPGVSSRDRWTKFSAFLIVGYLGMGRSFGYIGLPWINVYIGEVALVAFLLFGPSTKNGSWLQLSRRVNRLKRLDAILLLLLCYGGFEALHGVLNGYPAFTALRDTAFNYYPLFVLLGIWLGFRDRQFLRRVVRALAWFNGCFGVACVLFLTRIPWLIPGTAGAASPVQIFSGPYAASVVALLGLLVFEEEPKRVWHLISLNLFVLLGMLARAEWVGFAIGLLVLAYLTKRVRYIAVASSGALALLLAMAALGITLRSPRETGGEISPRYIVARVVAPFSKDMAASIAPNVNDIGEASGTTEWRLVWWAAIWSEVNASPSRMLLGLGYGYPIGNLNPFIEAGTFIQTPHNDLLYSLAYSGWLGVAFFIVLQVEIARLLLHTHRITGESFGLTCWAALLAMSFFEDFFETPYAAIPFFLLMGAAVAPGLIAKNAKRN